MLDFCAYLWYNGGMINDIIKLYREHKELKLVEIAYFFVMIISFVVAGFVALFNQPLGVSFLIIPLISLVAGVMNIVAWSLVKTGVEHLIAKQKSGEKSKSEARSDADEKAETTKKTKPAKKVK